MLLCMPSYVSTFRKSKRKTRNRTKRITRIRIKRITRKRKTNCSNNNY
jgi:hypothetical protein